MSQSSGIRATLAAVLVGCGLLAACSEPHTIVGPSPSSSPPQALPTPPPDSPTAAALAGVVFQTTAQGRRPVSGARVFVVDLIEGPYGDYGWLEALTDTNGRFSIATELSGRAVKITAYDGAGSGLWNQSGLSQLCAVHPTIDENTTADIELVQAGVLPSTYGSPTLSGVVFETSKGRRAVAGTPIFYSSYGHDGADVYTTTNAAGRYNFCGLPLGAGSLIAGCGGSTRVPVEIRGDAVLDVDITSAISSCP